MSTERWFSANFCGVVTLANKCPSPPLDLRGRTQISEESPRFAARDAGVREEGLLSGVVRSGSFCGCERMWMLCSLLLAAQNITARSEARRQELSALSGGSHNWLLVCNACVRNIAKCLAYGLLSDGRNIHACIGTYLLRSKLLNQPRDEFVIKSKGRFRQRVTKAEKEKLLRSVTRVDWISI